MSASEGGFSSVYEIFSFKSDVIGGGILERLIRTRMNSFMDILKPGAREGQTIDRTHFLSKTIPAYPIPIQYQYNQFTSPLLSRIEEQVRQIETLSTLRDTLLQKLISGELRIPDAEALVAEAGL